MPSVQSCGGARDHRGVGAPTWRDVGAPKRVILRFNSRLEKGLCTVILVGPQRRTILLLRQDENAGADTLIYDVPELPPGNYLLRWKVLSVDGHATEGVVPSGGGGSAPQVRSSR